VVDQLALAADEPARAVVEQPALEPVAVHVDVQVVEVLAAERLGELLGVLHLR
jgi:hypothetical protein